MKRSALVTIIVILAVLLAGGAILAMNRDSDDDTPETTTTQQTPSDTSTEDMTADESAAGGTQQTTQESVTIEDNAFTPATITIKAGTTVTWTNNDSVGHTVTPDEETDEFKASSMLSKGDTYDVTFNTPGTYTYFCEPHPFMKGTVVVTE